MKKTLFVKALIMLIIVSSSLSVMGFSPSGSALAPYAEPQDGDGDLDKNNNSKGGNSGYINPLTGLPVDDPNDLNLPPSMLSITNWPASARPQAGLDFSSIVFEIYIGEGMSRFLSLFYGSYPQEVSQSNPTVQQEAASQNTQVGPLRSGRLPYAHMQKLYSGFLVMASAYEGVMNNLGTNVNFYGSDADDINSAFVDVKDIKQIAQNTNKQVDQVGLGSNVFDPNPPAGGMTAPSFWFIYNIYNQIHWVYNNDAGAYNRYQDIGDGETFEIATDRLNGNALTYENVIVLFANHRYCTEVAFDIDLMYIERAPALLFRDGQVYEIFWTTKNEEYELTTGKVRPIRFIDADGNPIAFKPGQTWIHLVPYYTGYWEAPQSDVLYDLLNKEEPGTGNWVMRFFASLMIYDEDVCVEVKN